MNNQIQTTLAEINKVMGTNLVSTDTKITKKFGKRFFNVDTVDRVMHSTEFIALQRYANTYKKIEVSVNGLHKIAIFI